MSLSAIFYLNEPDLDQNKIGFHITLLDKKESGISKALIKASSGVKCPTNKNLRHSILKMAIIVL